MTNHARKSSGKNKPSAASGAEAAKKTAPKSRETRGNGAAITDQQRHNYVEVAAYYIAELRGFPGDSELQDWAEAELQIDRMLKEARGAL